MSLHPNLVDSTPASASSRRARRAVPGEIDGLTGPVELRRAAGGYLEVPNDFLAECASNDRSSKPVAWAT